MNLASGLHPLAGGRPGNSVRGDRRRTAGSRRESGLARRLIFLLTVVVALLLSAPPSFATKQQCLAGTTTEAARDNATDLVELEPNANRPTFDVALDDDEKVDDEELRLARKGSLRLGKVTDVGVEVIDPPLAGTERLRGAVHIAATVNQSKTRIIAYVCVRSDSKWDAGRYEGNILLFGPKIQDFTYPLVITTKWPVWVPLVVLGVSATLFFLIAWVTNSLTFQSDDKKKRRVATAVGMVFALVAVAPVFWSSYLNNATWGTDPPAQLIALGTAGLTAATAGLTAAHRLFGGQQGTVVDPHRGE